MRMGDYNKLIVNCSIKKTENIDALKQELKDRIGLVTSAYHCGGELIHADNEWDDSTSIVIVTQCKYGRGIEEFIEWLRPQVIQGMGDGGVFAIDFSEYGSVPTVYSMTDKLKKLREMPKPKSQPC